MGEDEPSGPERVRLSPALAALLGLGVAVFIAVTGYVSSLPGVHHHWPLAAAEGLVVGAVVAVIAAGRGLIMRERRPRPPRPPRRRR